jgi:hypothetical protein
MLLLLFSGGGTTTQPSGGWRDPPGWRQRRYEEEDDEVAAPLPGPVEVQSGAVPLPATVAQKPTPPRLETPSFDGRLALAGDRAATSLDAEIDRHLADIEARRRRLRQEDEWTLFFE